MKFIFVLEDDLHAEWAGEYETFELAFAEIRSRAQIPWNEKPNRAPCSSSNTCGRQYCIVAYDETTRPWTYIKSTPIVEIRAKGVRWEPEFEPQE